MSNIKPGAKKILELKDPRVVVGQVLLGVPDCGAEAFQTTVLLKSNPRSARKELGRYQLTMVRQ